MSVEIPIKHSNQFWSNSNQEKQNSSNINENELNTNYKYIDSATVQKIDEIYKYIQSEKRNRVIKRIYSFIYIAIFIFVWYYLYFVIVPGFMSWKWISDAIIDRFSGMVWNISKDIMDNMWTEWWSLYSEEMINKINDELSKKMSEWLNGSLNQEFIEKYNGQILDSIEKQINQNINDVLEKKLEESIDKSIEKHLESAIKWWLDRN